MKKTYVFDTSVLIELPDIISQFRRHNVFIPTPVIRQLDGLKNNENESVAYNARIASQYIEAYQGKSVRLISQWEPINILNNEADNQIVGSAVWLKRNGYDPILVSTDRNMRIVGNDYGVKTENRDPRVRKAAIWTKITLFLISVMIILYIIGIIESVHSSENTTTYVSAMIMSSVFFIMALISASMTVHYSPGKECNYSDDDYPDPVTDPEWADLDYNIWHHK